MATSPEDTTTVTVYEGSKKCRCGVLLTPLEVLYNTDGLCPECHADRVARLISNRMVDETVETQ